MHRYILVIGFYLLRSTIVMLCHNIVLLHCLNNKLFDQQTKKLMFYRQSIEIVKFQQITRVDLVLNNDQFDFFFSV